MERTKQLKVYISPEVHKRIKAQASMEGRSLSDLVEELLQRELEKKSKRYVLHKNQEPVAGLFFFGIFYLLIQRISD